jgi:hypothetical protein
VPRPHQALIGSAGRLLGLPCLRLAARAMHITLVCFFFSFLRVVEKAQVLSLLKKHINRLRL